MNDAAPGREDVRVRIIGVGGVGGRLAAGIGRLGLPNVDVAAVDTDHASLSRVGLDWTVPIGYEGSDGRGTGKRAAKGVEAANAGGPEIENLVAGGQVAVLLASFGGGTGAGAAPVIAGRLHKAGAVAMIVGIEPFPFEGEARRDAARKAAEFAVEVADCVVLVPTCLPSEDGAEMTFNTTVSTINEHVTDAVSTLAGVIVQPSSFDMDLGDVGRVLAKSGYAALGYGCETGAGAVAEAVRSACSSSLLDAQRLTGASSVLLHLSVGEQTTMNEIEQATALFSRLSAAGDFVLGVTTRSDDGEEQTAGGTRALVICSGFSQHDLPAGKQASERSTEELSARDPDAFYYDGKNIDIPTFLRRSRCSRVPAPA